MRGRTASGRASYSPYTTLFRSSRTAVRWGPRFSSSAPPRSPAPPFDHFPFGPAILRRRVRSAPCSCGLLNCSLQPGARGAGGGRGGREGRAEGGGERGEQKAERG